MSKPHSFAIGESVVYPAHGVGKIIDEEVQVVAGSEFRMLVITFEKDKMTLKIPKNRAEKTGLRSLTSTDAFDKAIKILQGKGKISKGMWSKRAQEYETKINSGNVESLAEVIRDLHRTAEDQGRSYSEKAIYDSALKRFIAEYAISINVGIEEAEGIILSILAEAKIINAAA